MQNITLQNVNEHSFADDASLSYLCAPSCRRCLPSASMDVRVLTLSNTSARWSYSDTPSPESFCRNCRASSYVDISRPARRISVVPRQLLVSSATVQVVTERDGYVSGLCFMYVVCRAGENARTTWSFRGPAHQSQNQHNGKVCSRWVFTQRQSGAARKPLEGLSFTCTTERLLRERFGYFGQLSRTTSGAIRYASRLPHRPSINFGKHGHV